MDLDTLWSKDGALLTLFHDHDVLYGIYELYWQEGAGTFQAGLMRTALPDADTVPPSPGRTPLLV